MNRTMDLQGRPAILLDGRTGCYTDYRLLRDGPDVPSVFGGTRLLLLVIKINVNSGVFVQVPAFGIKVI